MESVVFSNFKLYWRWKFEDLPWCESFSNKLNTAKTITLGWREAECVTKINVKILVLNKRVF